MDFNGDGVLQFDEFVHLMRSLGERPEVRCRMFQKYAIRCILLLNIYTLREEQRGCSARFDRPSAPHRAGQRKRYCNASCNTKTCLFLRVKTVTYPGRIGHNTPFPSLEHPSPPFPSRRIGRNTPLPSLEIPPSTSSPTPPFFLHRRTLVGGSPLPRFAAGQPRPGARTISGELSPG